MQCRIQEALPSPKFLLTEEQKDQVKAEVEIKLLSQHQVQAKGIL